MQSSDPQADIPDLASLATDLKTAWHAPGVTMRSRQCIVRALIADFFADVDDEARQIILTIHWRGGQHSQLRVRKLKSGEHGRRTADEAVAVIQSMAGRWADDHIAATLNRMGMRTGQGNTWTATRVHFARRRRGINCYLSADKNGDWRTMTEAAKEFRVTNHVIRRLIKDRELPAEQLVPRAPYQIKVADLHSERVADALAKKRPVLGLMSRPDVRQLTKRCIMNPSSPPRGACARPGCCRGIVGGSGSA